MSGLSAKCCGGCLSNFRAPEIPCVQAPQTPFDNCEDLLNASVKAILDNAEPLGSTVEEVSLQIQVNCGFVPNTQLLTQALNKGAKRGVLKRCARSGQPTFLVNAMMTLADPQNIKYSRCLCDMYRENHYINPRRPRRLNIKPLAGPKCTVTRDGITENYPISLPCSTCPDGCFSNPY